MDQTSFIQLNKPSVSGTDLVTDDKFWKENPDKIDAKLLDHTNKIGDLTTLTTTSKTDLVSAINNNVSSLADKTNQIGTQVSVLQYGADPTGVADSTTAFINAINAIKTTEYTEAIPTVRVVKKLKIPGGIYKISAKIIVPSYISIEGDGRHTTFLDSYITNGDPVLEITHNEAVKEQQFYNTLKEFTINGRFQNCQGIKFNSTSRWVIDNVIVNETTYEGLYFYESYLGDIKSVLVRKCGDATHSSVTLDGRDINYGSHGLTFIGGEIAGAGCAANAGLRIKFASSPSLFGTTIEGFSNGAGIVNESGQSTTVTGCYFEANNSHIQDLTTYASNYTGNYFGAVNTGNPVIGVGKMYGAVINGNRVVDSPATVPFLQTLASVTGAPLLQFSSVRQNYSPTYPLNIDTAIYTSARSTGTIIEMYDANSYNQVFGQQQFKDISKFEASFRPHAGVEQVGNPTTPGTGTSPNLYGLTGSPNGNILTYPGSLSLRADGGMDTLAYLKGVNYGNGNWFPVQVINSGTTASRPAVTTVGFQYFDTTLNKPIWTKTIGTKEIDTLTINAGATASGNITITLNGVGVTVAVAIGDSVGTIGDKIRATAFSGWTAGGTAGTATVTFTKLTPGTNSTPTFTDTGTTGSTGSFVVTTAGTNNTWVDATSTTV